MNYMRTRVEVYPVAADEHGIWLLSGPGPWTATDAVTSDSTPWWDCEALLREHGVRPSPEDDSRTFFLVNAVINHQTSDRWDRTGQIDTFVSVLPDGSLLPGALPISLPAVTAMGRPAAHASTEAPTVITAAGVLLHALRHLRFLYLFDATARRDMPPLLAGHLEALHPALAGLYAEEHRRAA